MKRVYVVQQMFAHRADDSSAFAERAARQLRALAGVWPEPTANGLMVLATAEAPLDAAATVLETLYPGAIVAGPRRVCYRRNPSMQPIMELFVRAPAVHLPVLLSDLEQRGARKRYSAIENQVWLVRAEAPMAALLGYGETLAALTDGSADHWITFKRWDPVEPGADRAPEAPARQRVLE
ncbi:MAG TPA: hypothetical protein VIL43_07720 [Burkholderiales bacterium]